MITRSVDSCSELLLRSGGSRRELSNSPTVAAKIHHLIGSVRLDFCYRESLVTAHIHGCSQ